jgi:hypothetical protein
MCPLYATIVGAIMRFELHTPSPPSPPFPPLQSGAGDKSYSKGDFILRSPNVVEMVTKTHAVIQEIFKRRLKIVFSNE